VDVKSVWSSLSSLFPVKVTVGKEKELPTVPAPVTNQASVVYANNDVVILLSVALILTLIAIIVLASRQAR
jgi:hypothetical protein